jgi:excisionase family DNA binding protein
MVDDRRLLLSLREAGELLGVSEDSVRRWLKRHGGPKPVKIGTRVLLRRSDLEAFVAQMGEAPPRVTI